MAQQVSMVLLLSGFLRFQNYLFQAFNNTLAEADITADNLEGSFAEQPLTSIITEINNGNVTSMFTQVNIQQERFETR